MTIETININWNTIEIEITYNDDSSKAHREIYGHAMAHLEIRSNGKQPLPMTETGYRSHFTLASTIKEQGGAETFVRTWLDHEAQSKAWQDYVERSKQLTLF